MRGRGDRRLDRKNLEQPLGRAGGLRDLAADFRERAERSAGEHGVEDELAEPARGHLRGQHVLGADPQHNDHARGDEENSDAGEQRAGADRVAGGAEGALDRIAKARDAEPLVGEGLQDAHRADQLGGIGRGVGERVLRVARAAAHGAGEGVERQHDERNRRKHEGGQTRTRRHHHDAGADEQHEIAQGDRDRRAGRGLDLRGVGGQPRDHLAGPGFIEEGGRQRGEVGEDVAAQVGDHALAERGDEVVAERAREREHRGNADHDQKVAVDERQATRGEAEVDHAPHRDRHGQRRQGREDQSAERRQRPTTVAPDVGEERRERPHIDPPPAGRWLCRRRNGFRVGRRGRRRHYRRDGRRILLRPEVHAPPHLSPFRRERWTMRRPHTAGNARLLPPGRRGIERPNFSPETSGRSGAPTETRQQR